MVSGPGRSNHDSAPAWLGICISVCPVTLATHQVCLTYKTNINICPSYSCDRHPPLSWEYIPEHGQGLNRTADWPARISPRDHTWARGGRWCRGDGSPAIKTRSLGPGRAKIGGDARHVLISRFAGTARGLGGQARAGHTVSDTWRHAVFAQVLHQPAGPGLRGVWWLHFGARRWRFPNRLAWGREQGVHDLDGQRHPHASHAEVGRFGLWPRDRGSITGIGPRAQPPRRSRPRAGAFL